MMMIVVVEWQKCGAEWDREVVLLLLLMVWEGELLLLLVMWEVLLMSFDYYYCCCYCLLMVNFDCCFDCCFDGFDGLLGERVWRQRHYGCERVVKG